MFILKYMDSKKLGAQLLQRRQIKKMSQCHVSELANVTQTTLSKVESMAGSFDPRLSTILKICDALGCDMILVEKITRNN